MATRQYIGARYVPKFASPVEWSENRSFDNMEIVTHNGNSFTSRKNVPSSVGEPEQNPDYWVLTSNFNAQLNSVEQENVNIKKDISQIFEELKKGFITEIQLTIENSFDAVTEVMYTQGFTADSNYFYVIFVNSAYDHQRIYKINRSTGAYSFNDFTDLGHGNGMTCKDDLLFISTWTSNNAQTSIGVVTKDLIEVGIYPVSDAIISLAKDEVTGKIYGASWTTLYELNYTNTLTVNRLAPINFPSNFITSTRQGMCAYDNSVFLVYSNYTGLLEFDTDGNFIKYIKISEYIDNLREVGESEDAEIVDGVFLFCDQTRHFTEAGDVPVAHISSSNISVPIITQTYNKFSALNHFDLYVDGHTDKIKTLGTKSNPFKEVWEACYCASVLLAIYGINSYIHVIDKDDNLYEYEYFEIRTGVEQLFNEAGSNKIVAKGVGVYGANCYIANVLCTKPAVGQTSAINVHESTVGLVGFNMTTSCTAKYLLNAVFSNMNLTSVLGVPSTGYTVHTSQTLRNANKTAVQNTNSQINCYYDVYPFGFSAGGSSAFNSAMMLATVMTGGNVTFDRINNTTSVPNLRRNFSEFGLQLYGRVYWFRSASNTVSIDLGNNKKVDVTISDTGMSLALTGVDTVYALFGKN